MPIFFGVHSFDRMRPSFNQFGAISMDPACRRRNMFGLAMAVRHIFWGLIINQHGAGSPAVPS